MYSIGALLPLFIALAGPIARPIPARRDEPSVYERQPVGWTDLLAEGVKGWVRVPIPPGGKLGRESQWSYDALKGVLTCAGDGGHEWLRWDREIEDAILHVEWRFAPTETKKRGYNSGVMARCSADGKIWHQAQTGDASGGYLFGESKFGDVAKSFNLAREAGKSRVKEAGEWNVFEITCKSDEMSLWVNGATTCRLEKSAVTRGFFGLEAEGWRIEFRNVKLKRL